MARAYLSYPAMARIYLSFDLQLQWMGVQAWSVEERCGGSRTGGAGSSGTAAATGTGTTPLPPPAGSASGGRPAWWSGSTTAGTTPTVIRQVAVAKSSW